MASNQPEKAAGTSIQQLSRRVQVAVTEALRTLDKVQAIDPSGQDEVDSLRSVVWSDLTGLESEFKREEGPRGEQLDRFFDHLLSNGDYVGQIESLAEALLGGAPPPTQPPPDSPVAGLFQLHGALVEIRRLWQELPPPARRPSAPPAAPPPPRREEVGPQSRVSHPVPPPAAPPSPRREEVGPQPRASHPAAVPVPPPAPRREEVGPQPRVSYSATPPAAQPPPRREEVGPQPRASHPLFPQAAPPPARRESAPARDDFFDEMGQLPSKREMSPPPPRSRPPAERPLIPLPKRQSGPGRDDQSPSGLGALASLGADVDTSRPRVLMTFVTVFVILALMGVGVIYLGLNNNSQASTGIVPSVVPTFSIDIPTTTPQPTPTLSSAAPQLQVTGNPLIVPCPGKGTNGFVLKNIGGQRLNWQAAVNTEPGADPSVTLTPASGVLYGPQDSSTAAITVTVKATSGNTDGTITISSNAGDPVVIVYHIHGC